MTVHYKNISSTCAFPMFQGERIWIGRLKDVGGAICIKGDISEVKWRTFNVISVSPAVRTHIFMRDIRREHQLF